MFIKEGELILASREDQYFLEFDDGQPLAYAVEDHFGEPGPNDDWWPDNHIGRVRLTIERLEEPSVDALLMTEARCAECTCGRAGEASHTPSNDELISNLDKKEHNPLSNYFFSAHNEPDGQGFAVEVVYEDYIYAVHEHAEPYLVVELATHQIPVGDVPRLQSVLKVWRSQWAAPSMVINNSASPVDHTPQPIMSEEEKTALVARTVEGVVSALSRRTKAVHSFNDNGPKYIETIPPDADFGQKTVRFNEI